MFLITNYMIKTQNIIIDRKIDMSQESLASIKSELKNKYKEFRYSVRDFLINRKNRDRLKNHDFTIIGSDCCAGCVYKDLKIRANTPTRNFYFNADDYVKFCQNLDYYLKFTPTEYHGNYSGNGTQYLMANLGDLKLFLVHYDNFEQFSKAWDRRSKRINKDNMFFLMNDRNYCSEKEIVAFDQLPYKNKVCFTHKPYPQYKSTFYIRGSEDKDYIDTITDYPNQLWIKRRYDQFDFVNWLNNGGDNWKGKENT